MNGFNKPVPLYPVPDAPAENGSPDKADVSLSTSQRFYKNPTGREIGARYEPTYVKLDKVVLKFDGYFKESVVESNLESWRVRHVAIYYYLEDHTLMINEPKQTNSGTPQGVFLKRQACHKAGGSDLIQPGDFVIGTSIQIFGRDIMITDSDKYTREFYQSAMGITLGAPCEVPEDNWKVAQRPVVTKKDTEMMDYLEHSLNGGKVAS